MRDCRTLLSALFPQTLALLLFANCASAATPRSTALSDSIRTLRSHAQFAAARPLALELIAATRADSSALISDLGDTRRQLELLDQILGMPRESQQELGRADSLLWASERLSYDDQDEEALAPAQMAHEIKSRLLDAKSQDVAETWARLGWELHQSRRVREAAVAYRKALDIYRQLVGDEHAGVSTLLTNLAFAIQSFGDLGEAEPLCRQAAAIDRRIHGPRSPEVSISMQNLGALLHARGDDATAEECMREALGIDQESVPVDSQSLARGMNNVAVVLKARGDFAAAESTYREALKLARAVHGELGSATLMVLNNLGSLLHTEHKDAEGERVLVGAVNGWRSLRQQGYTRNEDAQLSAQENLAAVWGSRGRVFEAESLYRRALLVQIRRLGTEHPVVGVQCTRMGLFFYSKGRLGQADSALSTAARIYESARLRAGTGLERSAFAPSPYGTLALVKLEGGKTGEAWPYAERERGRVLTDLLISSKHHSLSPAELAVEDSLKRELSRMERQYAALQAAATQDSGSAARAKAEQARTILLAVNASWSTFCGQVLDKYGARIGQPYSLEKVQAALGPETALLGWVDAPEGDSVRASWAYIIRSQGKVAWVRMNPPEVGDRRDGMAAESRRLRREISRPETGRRALLAAGERMSQLRFAGLLERLAGIRDLVVIPAGSAGQFPVEAFSDGRGGWISDHFNVSYAVSATIYAWLVERAREQPAVATNSGLFLGDPPFNLAQLDEMEKEAVTSNSMLASRGESSADTLQAQEDRAAHLDPFGSPLALSGLPRLPWTRTEVKGLADMTALATVLLGPDASEQTLARMADADSLRHFRIIHLATHAFVDQERPERSFLALSRAGLPDPLEAVRTGERLYEGRVTAGDVLMNWKLDADLVTLSACETGLGRSISGEGTVGFSYAFFQAGARSLLVSLWKVNDRATALLMKRFYQNWLGGRNHAGGGRSIKSMRKVEALREAKEWLRTYRDPGGRVPYASPYYWASFVLLGDNN